MLLWLDKVAMDYTNWDDRSFYNMDFGVVQSENGKWSLDNKWDRKPYICKTQKGKINMFCHKARKHRNTERFRWCHFVDDSTGHR